MEIFIYDSTTYISSKYGLIDSTGKELTELKYDYVEEQMSKEGFIAAFIGDVNWRSYWNGKWGYLNKTGEAIEIKYDQICSFTHVNRRNFQGPILDYYFFSYGLTFVRLDSKYGFIDTIGNIIIPIMYDYVSIFWEDYSMVLLDDKFGFIDTTGKVVIPIIYDDARPFNNGRARVRLNGEVFYINKKGEKI